MNTLTAAVMWLAIVLASGCGGSDARGRLSAEYDSQTGKLRLIRYDADGNGRADTFSYMDGTRVLRVDIDKDENGWIDRWEHYGPEGALVKVGLSRQNDGIEDSWHYPNGDGTIARIEISTRRNGVISRVERYEQNVLTQAEEDTDANGHVDKWESYEGGRLASVAFDTKGRGRADRRLTYDPSGVTSIEEDPTGTGQFRKIR